MINIGEVNTFQAGDIVEGTITGITSFGAFVKLGEGKEGLIHISEIANEYVTDIQNYVTLGGVVKVKVLGINKQKKFDLSLKQANAPAPEQNTANPNPTHSLPKKAFIPRKKRFEGGPSAEISPFEEKMLSFLKKSDEKQIDVRRNIQYKQGVKKKKKKI